MAGPAGMTALAPGSTIGILGGGQLGRMLALAGARLGLKSHIYAPEADCPAFLVAADHTSAAYNDWAAVERFAAAVDAVTYEFENVPVETVRLIEKLRPVRPGSLALETAQDRLLEKRLARKLGAKTAEFAAVESAEELRARIGEIGLPAVLKTTRFGYDGKGQAKILEEKDAGPAWAAMKGQPAILEQLVNFRMEASVIAARGSDGAFVPYDVSENIHRDHILHQAKAPAAIPAALAAEAIAIARRIGDALDYIGVFGVEFFIGDGAVYVNEMAPRVHNSGHWTMDACAASQFEQHMRAVAGWPLGDPARHSDVVMTNLLGHEADAWESLAREPGTAIHLYGKAEARRGRKMGHINRLTPRQA